MPAKLVGQRLGQSPLTACLGSGIPSNQRHTHGSAEDDELVETNSGIGRALRQGKCGVNAVSTPTKFTLHDAQSVSSKGISVQRTRAWQYRRLFEQNIHAPARGL